MIKSPGFPEKYPNSLECTYIIFAPKMSEIILEFESFELEPDSNTPGGAFCRYDRLEIWDGFPDGKRKMDCDMHNHYSKVGCRRHILIFLTVIIERSLLDLCETSWIKEIWGKCSVNSFSKAYHSVKDIFYEICLILNSWLGGNLYF